MLKKKEIVIFATSCNVVLGYMCPPAQEHRGYLLTTTTTTTTTTNNNNNNNNNDVKKTRSSDYRKEN
jgi:hypothetical protein